MRSAKSATSPAKGAEFILFSYAIRLRKRKTTLKPDDFFSAIEAGDTAAITNALAADPSLVEALNAEGLSPIMVAAYWGRDDVLPALIERKGPLEFWEAAIVGDAERLQELVDATPSLVREHSPDGFTGLHFAVFFGEPEAADVLLRAGADVTTRTTNVFHNQPLHAAVAGSDPRTRLDCTARLLQAGASPNERSEGSTPLMEAAGQGDVELVELLVAHGANAALVDDQGRSAADRAAEAGHESLAARLRELERPSP